MTFDEWWFSNQARKELDPLDHLLARQQWDEVLEIAAMVCDEMSNSWAKAKQHQVGDDYENCASAIRDLKNK